MHSPELSHNSLQSFLDAVAKGLARGAAQADELPEDDLDASLTAAAALKGTGFTVKQATDRDRPAWEIHAGRGK